MKQQVSMKILIISWKQLFSLWNISTVDERIYICNLHVNKSTKNVTRFEKEMADLSS
jgi:hypothetical protein